MNVGPRSIEHARRLLRIDTSNPGSTEERAAAYVVDVLSAAGLTAEVVEPEPGRCSVVSRMAGSAPDLPALLVHGHLDVVPPQDGGWTHDPLGGVEADGWLWGRGAVDMKGTVATMLAAQEALAGAAGPRTLVFAYFADEEMGGGLGAQWIVRHRPELLRGVQDALGEFGGFSVTLPDGRRAYPIQCAEKGMLWLRVDVRGRGGHAAYSELPNALVRAAAIVSEVAELALPGPPPPAHAALLDALAPLDRLGSFGAMASLGDRARFTPTMLAAGAKENMLPECARLLIDARFPPGMGDAALSALLGVLGPEEEYEVVKLTPGIERPDPTPVPSGWRAKTKAETRPESQVLLTAAMRSRWGS